MTNGKPTKAELIEELERIRARNAELEALLPSGDSKASGTNERLFESIVAAAPIAVFLYELDLQDRLVIRSVNAAAEKIMRTPTERFVGKVLEEIYPDASRSPVPQIYAEVARTGVPWKREGIHIEMGGREGYFDILAFQVAPRFVAAMIGDVTERVRAEEALRESDLRYRSFVESFHGIAFRGRFDFTPLFFHGAVEAITGYRESDFLAGNPRWDQIIHQEDLAELLESTKELDSEPDFSCERDYRIVRRNGEVRWVREFIRNVCDASGTPELVQGALYDITEHKRAEDERSLLVTAIEQSMEIILITDTYGTIQYVNPAFERLSGFARGEVIGKNPRLLKSGKHDLEFYRYLWGTISRGGTWVGRFTNKRKDGHLYDLDATISPVRNAAGQIVNYVGVCRNASREAELEEQLRHSQKMEAIGHLAGGVAHDFNNLLQGILGHTILALGAIDPNDISYEYLCEVRKAAERAGILTQQLLAFSRRQVMQPEPLDLNHLLQDVARMLRRVIGEHIDLDLLLDAELKNVNADHGQIIQVLLNLCVNARDAMADGGRIVVQTRNAALDEDFCETHPDARPGEYVMVSVSDSGTGMPPEVQEHLFEPFFTTKEVGKGTGLGLATVYGILCQHGGLITVESEPGRGSKFCFYLPAVDRASSHASQGDSGEVPGGNETVLVAEDDEMVRRLASKFLQSAGYHVLTASDGAEAIEMFDRHAGEIGAAFVDVVMPKKSGRAVYDHIHAINPTLPFVFCSGYGLGVLGADFLREAQARVVQKPYAQETLLRAIREAIDEKK